MAVKKSSTTVTTVMAELRKKVYSPVYILMGEEAYYIDLISDYIANNALTPDERDFNQSILFANEVSAAQCADLCREYPVMAQRRVVIVKEAQNWKDFEPMERYIEKYVKSTILVICYKNGVIKKSKKLLDTARAIGVVLECKKIYESGLPRFIASYLKEHNASIDEKSSRMIADNVGADLSRIVSELDKVLISLPDNNRIITPEIVEREIGISKDFNVFELKDAIVNKNAYKANLIVNYFNKNPKAGPAILLVSSLFSYFKNLMIAYYCPRKNDPQALASFLDMKNAWGTKDYLTGMKNYSGVKCMQIIGKIRETTEKINGIDCPNTDGYELLKELIFFILH